MYINTQGVRQCFLEGMVASWLLRTTPNQVVKCLQNTLCCILGQDT